MRKLLFAVVAAVGICGVSEGMQKSVTASHSFRMEESSSPFAFIGESPILEEPGVSPASPTTDPIWGQMLHSDEEGIERLLADDDLGDLELVELETKSPKSQRTEALEQAFFGNKILYKEFSTIKEKIIQGIVLPHSQVKQLNWLVQNRRGNYECAKMLVIFYGLVKEQTLMHSFWKRVALFLNLPVGKP